MRSELSKEITEATDECALDELVCDCFMTKAAEINNEGFESQIHFLCNWGVPEEDIRKALKGEEL